jgi:hypothetical protein
MTTWRELLRAGDPLASEPDRTTTERARLRHRILVSPRVGESPSRRVFTMMALVALMFIAIAAGSRYWAGGGDVVAAVRFEVRLAETQAGSQLREATIAGTGDTIYLYEESVVTNSDIAAARAVEGDPPGTFAVMVKFTPEGASKMLHATQEHLGRPVAILIDGEVVAAPVVRSAISTSAQITGHFTRAEVDRIVGGLIGH